MYNDTVTLFNRYVNSLGETIWYPHVISNANLIIDRAVINSKYGTNSNDNAVLNVKYSIFEENITIDGKTYLPPKKWENQTNDLLPQTITFNPGNEFDFFVAGDYFSQEPIIDENGTFFNEMQKEKDFVFAITGVSKYDLIQHFEIVGK